MLGRALASAGVAARVFQFWRPTHAALELASTRDVEKQICDDIRAGWIAGVFICLPGLRPIPKAVERFLGFALKRAICIRDVADACRIPWIIEVAAASPLAASESATDFLKRGGGEMMKLDYCAYGARWRHRVHLWNGNLAEGVLHSMGARLCNGRHVCSFTGLPHWDLSQLHGGQTAPVLAGDHPRELGQALASVFILSHAGPRPSHHVRTF